MDHFEDSTLGDVGGLSRAVLLRFTWLHHQENVRSMKDYIEDKKAFYFEKKKKRQIPSLYLNCYRSL